MDQATLMMGTWTMLVPIIIGSIGSLGIIPFIGYLIYQYVWQNFAVSFNINSTQPAYEWIMFWLNEHGPFKKIQHLTLQTKSSKISWFTLPSAVEDDDEKVKKIEYNWLPRPISLPFMHYKTGQWILMTINKSEDKTNRFWAEDATGGSLKQFETVTLYAFGTDTKIWADLVSEAKEEFRKKNDGKTVVYRYSNCWGNQGMWTVFGKPKHKRPWRTIVTQDNIKERISQDIKTFQNSAAQYKSRGMPYRRGYLLHGPPGTGKSSLVYGLAGELGVNLCVLTLSDKELTDEGLMSRLVSAPKNSIILIEDIDVAMPSEKRKKEMDVKKQRSQERNEQQPYSGSLTMSGILNAIDGVTTAEAQILIMTTNHKDNLDPALIRPGRVDKDYYLDTCNVQQVRVMFRNFFENATEKDVEKMGKLFENIKTKEPISPAAFENYLSQFKENAKEAINKIDVLEKMVESDYRLRYYGKTIVYRYDQYGQKWAVFGKPCAKRPWKSVVTQNRIKENLLKDVENFQQKEKLYTDRGIPYRRGYLFHGPPGTGKSSLAYCIAGKLDYGICALSLTDRDMTDADLMRRLASVPAKCIVLIEDIDVALPSQKRKRDIDTANQRGKEVVRTNLTLSGVLNAIDGVDAVHSQILIMTTNYKEDLDPALIRPGRVDENFYLGNCSTEQVKDMFCHFFPGSSENDTEKMATLFERINTMNPVSPAAIENYLSRFEINPQDALENISKLEESLKSEAQRRYNDKTIVYSYSNDERKWKVLGNPRAKRNWKSIVTQNNIKETFLEEIERFQKNEGLYHDLGIPYRRGFLLYGPPGTGKSSLVYTLAGKLDYGICFLRLSDKGMNDDNLMQQLATVPNNCLILIEDIDVAIPSQKRKAEMKKAEEKGEDFIKSNVTLSGILNAIDGVQSVDSQILIMTTNHKEHLDPAIIRPGRVDVEFCLDNCNTAQIKEMFCNFFPDANKNVVNEFMNIFDGNQKLTEDPISPAELQGYLLRFVASPSDALNNIHILKEYLSFNGGSKAFSRQISGGLLNLSFLKLANSPTEPMTAPF